MHQQIIDTQCRRSRLLDVYKRQTLFIYSCSSNDKLDINTYQLQSIQWKLSADDAEKVDTIELPPKITSNNTEEPMSITFSFEKNIKETRCV